MTRDGDGRFWIGDLNVLCILCGDDDVQRFWLVIWHEKWVRYVIRLIQWNCWRIKCNGPDLRWRRKRWVKCHQWGDDAQVPALHHDALAWQLMSPVATTNCHTESLDFCTICIDQFMVTYNCSDKRTEWINSYLILCGRYPWKTQGKTESRPRQTSNSIHSFYNDLCHLCPGF